MQNILTLCREIKHCLFSFFQGLEAEASGHEEAESARPSEADMASHQEMLGPLERPLEAPVTEDDSRTASSTEFEGMGMMNSLPSAHFTPEPDPDPEPEPTPPPTKKKVCIVWDYSCFESSS